MKILIIANHYNTLRIFRRELIKEIAKEGHEVVVSIPACEDEYKDVLESYGCTVKFIDSEFERRETKISGELKLIKAYRKIIAEEKPDKVITYTVKCNIYGALACKKYKVEHYANITGLGSTFYGGALMRTLISLLYRFSLNKSKRVFLENTANRDLLVSKKIIKGETAVVLSGAGVNLDEFPASPYPDKDAPTRFLFAARIMREKGVDEYIDALTRVKAVYPDVQFDFIGWYEDDYEATVKDLEKRGLINHFGFQPDVLPFIRNAHCTVLPSWHEGMSNTLLESASMCRALIASDIHGCKEAIEDGVTGYVFEVKNADKLYDALIRFIELPYEEKVLMGQNGRKRMETIFDKKLVVADTMKEIFEDK